MHVQCTRGKEWEATLNAKVQDKQESFSMAFQDFNCKLCEMLYLKPIAFFPFCIGIFYSGHPHTSQKQPVHLDVAFVPHYTLLAISIYKLKIQI